MRHALYFSKKRQRCTPARRDAIVAIDIDRSARKIDTYSDRDAASRGGQV